MYLLDKCSATPSPALQQTDQVDETRIAILPSALVPQKCDDASFSDMSVSVESSVNTPSPSFKSAEVDGILQDYETEHSAGSLKPIVSRIQGEHKHPTILPNYPPRHRLYTSCKMKPRKDAYFRIKENELELEDVILFLLHDDSNFLTPADWSNLSRLDDDFSLVISEANCL